MQQRQLRLGDILDDYCTRERRLTNHAVVAMVGNDVKQTRCTTCDTEHEYKHAKVPRQRRKSDSPAALFAQVVAGAPKVVAAPQPAASIRADELYGNPVLRAPGFKFGHALRVRADEGRSDAARTRTAGLPALLAFT